MMDISNISHVNCLYRSLTKHGKFSQKNSTDKIKHEGSKSEANNGGTSSWSCSFVLCVFFFLLNWKVSWTHKEHSPESIHNHKTREWAYVNFKVKTLSLLWKEPFKKRLCYCPFCRNVIFYFWLVQFLMHITERKPQLRENRQNIKHNSSESSRYFILFVISQLIGIVKLHFYVAEKFCYSAYTFRSFGNLLQRTRKSIKKPSNMYENTSPIVHKIHEWGMFYSLHSTADKSIFGEKCEQQFTKIIRWQVSWEAENLMTFFHEFTSSFCEATSTD